MATWSRKCTGMTQEEVDALHMKIAMKQEQHLIPLKEDLADWLNKTLVSVTKFLNTSKNCPFPNAQILLAMKPHLNINLNDISSWMLAVAQNTITGKCCSKKLTPKEVELFMSLGIMRHHRKLYRIRLLDLETARVCDWIREVLKVDDITVGNFMDKLDNGVIICKLARLIQDKAEECKRQGLITESVPSVRFKCWENAKSESFYARDNAENFIRWCRKFGVHEAVIFESDGLVLHTQPRTVVLCLLELGRIASKYDIEPPGLVQLEKEIDEQEEDRSSDGLSSLSTGSSPTLVRSRTESALSLTSNGSSFLSPTSPDSGIDQVGNHRPRNRLSYTPPSSNSSSAPQKKHKPSELDKKVMKIANNVCKEQQITRISEGKYCIGGKNVFVRLLKGRHVMVRVGGGWDTLEHFLSRHEPCQVIVVNRKASLSDEYVSLACNGSPDSFLHIRAKYKSPLPTPTTPEFKLIQ